MLSKKVCGICRIESGLWFEEFYDVWACPYRVKPFGVMRIINDIPDWCPFALEHILDNQNAK